MFSSDFVPISRFHERRDVRARKGRTSNGTAFQLVLCLGRYRAWPESSLNLPKFRSHRHTHFQLREPAEGLMNLIRVLVANRPKLIRELILATISDQPDIEVVGEIRRETDLENAVNETRPDVLIVALDSTNRLPGICSSILRNYPQLRVIAIAPDRNSSMFYQASLHIESNPIEASEEGVLTAIRGKMPFVHRVQ